MEFVRYTPFPFQAFATLDLKNRLRWVCVLKAACRFDAPDRWCEDVSICYSDEYTGEPVQSSIRRASDLAPFKPRAEVYAIDPVAYSRKPTSTWTIYLKVGHIRVDLRVFGRRNWRRNLVGIWSLDQPEPTTAVPVQFESAFGGVDECGHVYEPNPVGKGYHSKARGGAVPLEAPQVLFAGEGPSTPEHQLAPAALSPVGPAWFPRRGHAGTYDVTWMQHRWPLLPRDFNFRFYNVAPMCLQSDQYFSGSEHIEMCGLSAHGKEAFHLPGGLMPGVIMRISGKERVCAPLKLDTLVLDFSRRQIEGTFRACFIPPDGVPLGEVVNLATTRTHQHAA